MKKDWLAWMPTDPMDDLDGAQYLLAIKVPPGRKLDSPAFEELWAQQIAELMDQSLNPQVARDHLQSKLEDLNLLPQWMGMENLLEVLNPSINQQLQDLMGSWWLGDILPNKPLTETNKEAEELIKGRDSSTWVDNLSFQ
jgi:hypothetical protein